MNRRSFLRGIGPASGAVVALASTRATADTIPDRLTYGPWHLAWGGFRSAQNDDVQVGYWIAWNPITDKRAYTSTGGVSSPYHVGETFDRSHPNHELLTTFAADEERAIRRQKAYEDLLVFLDTQKWR